MTPNPDPQPMTDRFGGVKRRRRLKVGDRVSVVGDHPWAQHSGHLIAFEKYGLGWMGWRVELDGNCGECYANANQLIGSLK